jgi:methyltransferase (TIGR00027 family)
MTAKLAAAGRARESERPDRLSDDPFAAELAGPDGFRWMGEWRLPGMSEENPTIGPRTRFFDDLVLQAMEQGIRQIVLVAAGMDTRAFRLPLPAEARLFELDQGSVLAEKQATLDALQAMPLCHRVAVAVDLEAGRWPNVLRAAGFDTSIAAAFVVEGLSWYLTEEENALLLGNLASLGAQGSRLGLDMLSRDYLDNPAVAPLLDLLETKGIAWKFGTNEPGSFLKAHGWSAEVEDFDAVGRRFGRWPPPGVPEEVAAQAAKASRSFFIRARRLPQPHPI